MPQREFEITIAPNGNVELHIKGYKGKSCLEVVRFFEQIVGIQDRIQRMPDFGHGRHLVGALLQAGV